MGNLSDIFRIFNIRSVFSIASLAIALTGSAWGLPYSGLYVFGDSLADSGNNAILFDTVGGPRTTVPIVVGQNGVNAQYVPTYPYTPSNNYSNGPVWSQQFAQMAGFSATPSLLGGNNYAFGGARIGSTSTSFPVSLPGQVALFLGSHPTAPGDALYIIEGGGNDVRDAFAAVAGGGSASAIINAYITNMVGMLTSLYNAGGRDFVVWNNADLSVSPAIKSLNDPAAVTLALNLTTTMNGQLNTALDSVSLNPGLVLTRFDIFGLVNQIVANPANFGLTNASDPCAVDPACVGNATTASGYFFWDGIHPTTAADAIIARSLLAAIPEPNSLVLVLLGLFLLRCASQRVGTGRL